MHSERLTRGFENIYLLGHWFEDSNGVISVTLTLQVLCTPSQLAMWVAHPDS